MPRFTGTDFTIELPVGCSDESSYAFAFPARANFRPSVVVKTERLAGPMALEAYVAKQLDTIKGLLPNVEVLTIEPAADDGTVFVSVYEFGEPVTRVRQKQRYLLLQDPVRVVTLTGTSSKETFDQVQDLFDAVMASFTPLVREAPE